MVGILGTLIAVSLPNFQDTMANNVINSQAKLFITTLNLARSEVIKRGTNVGICPSNDGLDCDAASGSARWIVFVDVNGDADGVGGSNRWLSSSSLMPGPSSTMCRKGNSSPSLLSIPA